MVRNKQQKATEQLNECTEKIITVYPDCGAEFKNMGCVLNENIQYTKTKPSTIFISGKITGDDKYKMKFERARLALESEGFSVVSPALLPSFGFSYEAYMRMCTAMIEECEGVCFLPDWKESTGAMYEYGLAIAKGKVIFQYEEWERENAEKEQQQL